MAGRIWQNSFGGKIVGQKSSRTAVAGKTRKVDKESPSHELTREVIAKIGRSVGTDLAADLAARISRTVDVDVEVTGDITSVLRIV